MKRRETTSKQQHGSLTSLNPPSYAKYQTLFYLGHSTLSVLQQLLIPSTHAHLCMYYICLLSHKLHFMWQCDYTIYLFICLFTLQRLPNGTIDAHDDGSRVSELQELLDRTNKELAQSREHSATLSTRMTELEAELANAHRELNRSEELSIKQQREQREVRLKHICFSSGSFSNL